MSQVEGEMDVTKELTSLLQQALRLEQSAYIQYLSHAEVIVGESSPCIIDQLRDNAGDEAKHAEVLRDLIGNYLVESPTMEIAETHPAEDNDTVLQVNIKDEKSAIKHYSKTLQFIESNPDIEYYQTYWEKIRSIMIEEEQHVTELQVLQW